MRNRHSDLWIPCTDALPLSHKVQLCSSYVPEIVLKRLCIYRKFFVLVTEGLVSIKGFSQPSVAHLSKKNFTKQTILEHLLSLVTVLSKKIMCYSWFASYSSFMKFLSCHPFHSSYVTETNIPS